MLKPSIANEAKKRGGDAVVFLGGQTDVAGFFSHSFTPQSTITAPASQTAYRFAVIKYLD
jgi:hypothetical protein